MKTKEKKMETRISEFARFFDVLCSVCNGSTDIPFAVIERAGFSNETLRPILGFDNIEKGTKKTIAAYIDRYNAATKEGENLIALYRQVSLNGKKPVLAHTISEHCGELKSITFAIGKIDIRAAELRYPNAQMIKCPTPKAFSELCLGKSKVARLMKVYSFEKF